MPKKNGTRTNGDGKSSARAHANEQGAALMQRLTIRAHLDELRRALQGAPTFGLEALALEALAVARARGDADGLIEIETTLRRVLNRAWEPRGPMPSVLPLPEATRLLQVLIAPAVDLARAADGKPAALLRKLDATEIVNETLEALEHVGNVFELPAARLETEDVRRALCAAALSCDPSKQPLVVDFLAELGASRRIRDKARKAMNGRARRK